MLAWKCDFRSSERLPERKEMPCSKVYFVVFSPKPQLLPMLVLSLSLLEHETWSDDGHGTFYVLHILHFTAQTRPGMWSVTVSANYPSLAPKADSEHVRPGQVDSGAQDPVRGETWTKTHKRLSRDVNKGHWSSYVMIWSMAMLYAVFILRRAIMFIFWLKTRIDG